MPSRYTPSNRAAGRSEHAHELRNSKRARVRGHSLGVSMGQLRVAEENTTKVMNEDKTQPSMSE